MYACTHTHARACACTHTCICMCVRECVHVHACVCSTHTHTHTHTHAHTHTHTHTHRHALHLCLLRITCHSKLIRCAGTRKRSTTNCTGVRYPPVAARLATVRRSTGSGTHSSYCASDRSAKSRSRTSSSSSDIPSCQRGRNAGSPGGGSRRARRCSSTSRNTRGCSWMRGGTGDV